LYFLVFGYDDINGSAFISHCRRADHLENELLVFGNAPAWNNHLHRSTVDVCITNIFCSPVGAIEFSHVANEFVESIS